MINRFDRDGMDHINGTYCNYADVEKVLTQLEEANKLLMFLEPNLEDGMQDKVTEYLDRNDSIKVSQ